MYKKSKFQLANDVLNSHEDTGHADIRTQSLSHPSGFPEDAQDPVDSKISSSSYFGRDGANSLTDPCFRLSSMVGAAPCTYVEVQIIRRITRRRDWKLKRADWRCSARMGQGLYAEIPCWEMKISKLLVIDA